MNKVNINILALTLGGFISIWSSSAAHAADCTDRAMAGTWVSEYVMNEYHGASLSTAVNEKFTTCLTSDEPGGELVDVVNVPTVAPCPGEKFCYNVTYQIIARHEPGQELKILRKAKIASVTVRVGQKTGDKFLIIGTEGHKVSANALREHLISTAAGEPKDSWIFRTIDRLKSIASKN